jgi:hypothetical protein
MPEAAHNLIRRRSGFRAAGLDHGLLERLRSGGPLICAHIATKRKPV